MQMLIVLLAGIVLVGLAILLMRRGGKKKTKATKQTAVSVTYVKRTTLLTPAELSLQAALRQAVADQFDIYAKVRLADIVTVPGNLQREQAIASLNQIRPRVMDFVLCDKQTTDIRCGIRVLDESDDQSGRKQNTAFIDKVCSVAGIALVKFPIAARYDVENVKQQLDKVLRPAEKPDDSGLSDIKIFIEPEENTTKVSVEST